MADTLESVVRPSLIQQGDPPEWVSNRSQDVRAFDRRLVDEDGKPRLVLGPSHHFEEPSDVLLENGLWRVWPGPWGYAPFLHVEAFLSGEWHHAGVLSFERDLDDELVGARLLRLTPDVGVLALNSTGLGEVLVTLRRGERMVRVQNGSNRLPQDAVGRYCRWRGVPPFEGAVSGSSSTIYLDLPGATGDYASTSDSAALSITGDIDLRAAVEMDDWKPSATSVVVSKDESIGNERSFYLAVLSSGVLRLLWSEDGSAGIFENSTVAPTVDDGDLLLLRATLDVDDGASNHVVTFYTKTSTEADAHTDLLDDTGWIQLGSAITTAGVTSINDGVADVEVGSRSAGDNPTAGKFYAVVMKDGIDGTTVASPDFTAQVPYSRSFDDDEGNTWSINGDAEIVGAGTHSGKFGTGISGYVKWPWLSRLTGDWGLAFWWLPANDSTAQPDSGLLSIVDSSGDEVGKVEWLADTDRIRFELGADFIEITGLTFSANDPVFVSPTFSESDGMGLTVNDGSTQHTSDDTATTEPADLDRFYWGLVYGGNTWGDETTWGDDDEVWGGAVISHGVVDNLQGFVGFLSEAERASLAGATSGLDGLPEPLSRLVFYAPVDVEPVPLASSLSSGRRNEVDSADARLAHDGLTKGLGILTGNETAGLSVGRNKVLEAGAYLATTNDQDDLSDQHEQFSADQEQEVRAR